MMQMNLLLWHHSICMIEQILFWNYVVVSWLPRWMRLSHCFWLPLPLLEVLWQVPEARTLCLNIRTECSHKNRNITGLHRIVLKFDIAKFYKPRGKLELVVHKQDIQYELKTQVLMKLNRYERLHPIASDYKQERVCCCILYTWNCISCSKTVYMLNFIPLRP